MHLCIMKAKDKIMKCENLEKYETGEKLNSPESTWYPWAKITILCVCMVFHWVKQSVVDPWLSNPILVSHNEHELSAKNCHL